MIIENEKRYLTKEEMKGLINETPVHQAGHHKKNVYCNGTYCRSFGSEWNLGHHRNGTG